jgi:hypothetical protein
MNHQGDAAMSNDPARYDWIVLGFVAALVGCNAELKMIAPRNDAGSTADSRPDAAAADAGRADTLAVSDLRSGGGGGPDAACATQSAMAERLPLDLYVMMDSSGSMLDPTSDPSMPGATKWDAVKAAMTNFFNDAQSAGIGIGIQYFPQIRPGVPTECFTDPECGTFGPCFRLRTCSGSSTIVACNVNSDCGANRTCVLIGACSVSFDVCAPAGSVCGVGDVCTAFSGYCLARDNCDIAPYATPAVSYAALPGAAPALISSLETHELDGLTPTAPAISGAIQNARQRASANPGHKVAVLLVTDGFPSECAPIDIPGIAALAMAGARGTPAIPMFVIGVFAPEDAAAATVNLNALAQGGGTGNAVIVSTNQNVTQLLGMALNQIRTTAVACEYKIPPAISGAIDFNKVNVQFTAANGAISTVGYVKTSASCDPTRGGWYYDVDPATGGTPTSIVSCAASCSQFRADTGGRVNIVLGCQTFVII